MVDFTTILLPTWKVCRCVRICESVMPVYRVMISSCVQYLSRIHDLKTMVSPKDQ